MSVSLTQEVAESINSALFQSDFQNIGNSEGGRVEWWHRGDRTTPKQLRVAVEQVELVSYVKVTADWPTPGGAGLRTGSVNWLIPCDGSQTRDQTIDATVEVVVKILELFRDILQGTGLAVPAPTPTEETE